MGSIRIRLCFAPELASKLREPCEQCWMLVDVERCKCVYDLEFLIQTKFFTEKKGISLSLYLDDFLLPSKEKIQIIRENDVISVKGELLLPTHKNSIQPCTNGSSLKKRKLENSDDSRKKSKKIKESPTDNMDEKEPNSYEKIVNKPNHRDKQKTSRTKSIKNTLKKGTCQKAVEFLHKVSQEVSSKMSRGTADGENNVKNKQERRGSTRKNKHNNTEHAFNKDTRSVAQELVTSTVNNKTEDTSPKINGNVNDGKAKDKADIRMSVSRKSKSSSPQKDISKKLSQSKYDNVLQKGTASDGCKVNGQKPSSTASFQGYKHPDKEKHVAQNNLGSHIRFDEDDSTGHKQDFLAPAPPTSNTMRTGSRICPAPIPRSPALQPTLPPPNIQAINRVKTITNAESPQLSPIHPISGSSNFHQEKGPNPQYGQKFNNYKNSANHFKKDVYTNKSIILESTRVEKQPDQQKDYSVYPLLHVPPRVGETIAYKVLELSQSYTPEISKYKEGKVLAFDPQNNNLKLKLSKESLSRVEGDGHVSFKFELFDINEESGELVMPEVEVPDEVNVVWSSMIQPRLVPPGN